MADEHKTSGPGDAPKLSDPDYVEQLLSRANKGDRACLPQIRQLLDDPKRADMVRAYGSPPAWLETQLLDAAAGKSVAVREASSRQMAGLRRELEGPDPSPTERLLAERAVICWWLVHRYEATYAQSEGLSIKQAEFQRRRIDRAHARFLSSLRTLATVRKLAVPSLQVNIGTNQVNTLRTDGIPMKNEA